MKSSPRLARWLLSNVVLVVAIELVIAVNHQAPLLLRLDDIASDLSMRAYQGLLSRDETPAFTFIDIDEPSWRAWEEPLLTPRDKLGRFILAAAQHGAAAVILDFDLSYPDLSYPERDEALRQAVAERPTTVPLILARRVECVEPRSFFTVSAPMCAPEGYRIGPSILDDTVVGAANTYWAEAAFERDDDFTIRRWLLWLDVHQKQGGTMRLPSIQLLIAALVQKEEKPGDKGPEARAAVLRDALRAKRPKIDLDGTEINLRSDTAEDGAERLVRFVIPPRACSLNERDPGTWVGTCPQITHNGIRGDILTVLSAKRLDEILRSNLAPNLGEDWFNKRIVVIGSSFEGSGDIYPTPVGIMPGALILINAIETVLQFGHLHRPAAHLDAVLGILLGLAVAFCLGRWPRFGVWLALPLVLGTTVALNLSWLPAGIWAASAVPALALLLHWLWGKLEDLVAGEHHRRALGDVSTSVAEHGREPPLLMAFVPLALLAMGVPGRPAVAQHINAAVITDLSPEPDTGQAQPYEVIRAGSAKPQKVGYWMRLYPHDRVRVIRPEARVVLLLIPDRREVWLYAGDAYEVPQPVQRSKLDVLIENMAAIGSWFYAGPAQETTNTISRGPPLGLRVPLLDSPQRLVAAGLRPVSLGWIGGTPPFTVRLVRVGSPEPLVASEDLQGQRFGPVTLDLAPGAYRVEIYDRAGDVISEPIKAVDRAQMPVSPEAAELPDPAGATLGAALLARRDDSRWMLESYWQAAALAAEHDYGPARLLRDGLAQGQLPPGEP